MTCNTYDTISYVGAEDIETCKRQQDYLKAVVVLCGTISSNSAVECDDPEVDSGESLILVRERTRAECEETAKSLNRAINQISVGEVTGAVGCSVEGALKVRENCDRNIEFLNRAITAVAVDHFPECDRTSPTTTATTSTTPTSTTLTSTVTTTAYYGRAECHKHDEEIEILSFPASENCGRFSKVLSKILKVCNPVLGEDSINCESVGSLVTFTSAEGFSCVSTQSALNHMLSSYSRGNVEGGVECIGGGMYSSQYALSQPLMLVGWASMPIV